MCRDGVRLGLVVLGVVLLSTSAWCADSNPDIHNISGVTAYDITVVLKGDLMDPSTGLTEIVTDPILHYSEYAPLGPNTRIWWWGGPVPHCTKIHIGWSTATHTSEIIDMYWTDEHGNPIPDKKIAIVGGHIGDRWFEVRHIFEWGGGVINVSNINYAFLAARLPLSELNRDNDSLSALLHPLPGGEDITLAYGQRLIIPFPDTVPTGYAVVMRYAVTAPGSAGEIVYYFQDVPEAGEIPTFSEWGVISFGILLLTGLLFCLRRRRRMVAA